MSGACNGRRALLEKFRALTLERLERLNGAFVALERHPADQVAAAALMREIHTLKGEAKLMRLRAVTTVAHRTEDLLVRARDRGFRFEPGVADFVLRAFDLLDALVRQAGTDAPAEPDLSAFTEGATRLLSVTASAQGGASGTPSSAPGGPGPTPVVRSVTAHASGPPKQAHVEPQTETSLRIDVAQIEQLTRFVGDLLQQQGATEHSLDVLARLTDDCRRRLHELRGWTAGGAAGSGQPADSTQQDRLNRELTELVDLGTDVARTMAQVGDVVYSTAESVRQLDQTVRDLRLVPLLSLFSRYPRAVRDLAHEQGKKVSLRVRGGDLRLDKYIVDRIGEPLLHLIRNSIDHGIEAPDERAAAGKAEEGTLSLSASQVGPRMELVVGDDGRGLAADVIRDAAVSRHVITAAQAEEMTPEQLLQLVFRPGFSTRGEVTDLSGRGIGLDVVKASIESLGGEVRVDSRAGQYAHFVASVPVFAALSRALLVDMGPLVVALPSTAVVAITDLSAGQLVRSMNVLALRHDEEVIPLRELRDLLGLPSDNHSTEVSAIDHGSAVAASPERVVIIEAEGRRLGLIVPLVAGEQELLQRPVGAFLEGDRLLIGATVLEAGRPALILNVGELVRRAEVVQGYERTQARRDEGCRVLVVDDSALFRETLAGMVREMGHEVVEASNGRQALARLLPKAPDLVITDLEMPLMDGFELIASIRSMAELQQVPIVVVSAQTMERDKQRALRLGAQAYLVKTGLSKQALGDTLRRARHIDRSPTTRP